MEIKKRSFPGYALASNGVKEANYGNAASDADPDDDASSVNVPPPTTR